MQATQTVRAVYVAWQQPETRSFFVVARLVAGAADGAGNEFAYVHGAREAVEQGFQPFLAFPNLDEVYRSKELFPFFTNRIMQRSRPDFPEYARRLGMDPGDAEDIDILICSGGVRATDSIEIFQLPTFNDADNRFQTEFMVHGTRYLSDASRARILQLQVGDELTLRPEPDCKFDSNAVQLYSEDEVLLGYVPRYLAPEIGRMIRHCNDAGVRVAQMNPPPAPYRQLLLCRLSSPAPAGFEPGASAIYQPISPEAVSVNRCD